MEIRAIRTPGLGDASYVLAHEGVGVLVDPQRDVDRFLQVAVELDVELRWVLETHLHNDYVSGGRDAASRTGAELVLPASAVVPFRHTPAFHTEDLAEGGLTIRPWHTPGHTPEHTSYVVLIDGEPVAVFSGGSLLVGSAGRSDLLGDDRAVELARAQRRSVHRLADLPDEVQLLPTHGEGSFCTVTGAGRRTSTIGREKAESPVLAYPDEDAYIAGELSGLASYPSYYAHMGPINLQGPTPLPAADAPRLTIEEVDALGEGVRIVDARDREAFAAGHVDGAIGVELSDRFGVWLGWVLPFDAPIVLVVDDDVDVSDAVVQLGRIGFDHVLGTITVEDWTGAGRPTRSYRTVTIDEVAAEISTGSPQVLDVRAPDEWASGHVDGSVHRYVPDLVTDGVPADLDADREVWVLCGSGFRATIAAVLLERAGCTPVVLVEHGTPEVLGALARVAA
jgi:glyoxylase-like metal-dependent hydrolase (beta-lactamase superfamily II)/rhodanese-related sulfurtransferase